MKTLERDKQEVLRRLAALRADSSRSVMKWGALYFPGMEQRAGGTLPAEFSADREQLVGLIERFLRRDFERADHPIFGAMNIIICGGSGCENVGRRPALPHTK